MSDKELDEIFKKKLTNREFGFNQANWEAMEAILDADKKPAVFYWWTSAAIVAFGLVTSAILFLQNPRATEIPSVLPLGQENVTTTVGDENSNIQEIPTGNALETDAEFENITDQSLESNSTENLGSNQAADPLNTVNALAGTSTNASTTNSGQNNADPAVILPGNGAGSSNIVVGSNNSSEVSNSLPLITENLVEEKNKEGLLFLSGKGFPAFENPSIDGDLITNRVRPNFIRRFQKQHELSLVGGIGLNPSFNNSGSSADWLIGLNYEYRFSFFWSVNVGLNYNARTSPGIKHSSDSTFLSFGRELVITEVENTRLDYVELPIQITHTISPRHQLGLGMYASALFNIVTQTDRTSITVKETVTHQTKTMGLSDNFRTFDYGLTGSYNYQYNPALSLGLQFKYGLSDITVNNTPELSGFHRNVSTRLILRYRLF